MSRTSCCRSMVVSSFRLLVRYEPPNRSVLICDASVAGSEQQIGCRLHKTRGATHVAGGFGLRRPTVVVRSCAVSRLGGRGSSLGDGGYRSTAHRHPGCAQVVRALMHTSRSSGVLTEHSSRKPAELSAGRARTMAINGTRPEPPPRSSTGSVCSGSPDEPTTQRSAHLNDPPNRQRIGEERQKLRHRTCAAP